MDFVMHYSIESIRSMVSDELKVESVLFDVGKEEWDHHHRNDPDLDERFHLYSTIDGQILLGDDD